MTNEQITKLARFKGYEAIVLNGEVIIQERENTPLDIERTSKKLMNIPEELFHQIDYRTVGIYGTDA